MKTYSHLYEEFYTEENMNLAIRNSSKGSKKKKRRDVKYALSNIPKFKERIWERINNFTPSRHRAKTIYDGISRKKRTIIVPSYPEQVIQHMLINVLSKVFLRGIYEHAYGSIPKRGAQKGKKAIERWRKMDPANFKYCLKLDIKKYFESIPHDILKQKLSREIKDDRIIHLLFATIDSVETGLPLGFYTSQWLAMWYLKDFDHFVKEKCYAPHYMRYMDDMIIIGSNKRKLHQTHRMIIEHLRGLGLELNNRCQLFRVHYIRNGKDYGRDIDFMGYRFFRNRTIMRRGTYYKMLRKARKIGEKEKPSIYELRQMMSYLGLIKDTDVYNVYLLYIKPFFNVKKAKKRISKYDKRKNKERQQCMTL